MTERGIIFSAPMVLAIGEGRKTQTRRLATSPLRRCVPGDVLYVRETWRTLQKWDDMKPRHVMDDIDKIDFAATGFRRNKLWAWGKTRPAIFMPRWASRFDLLVEEVRKQRLQDITDADALAEGIATTDCWREEHPPHICFSVLWNRLHGATAWDANPEIVALTFRVERRF